MTIVSLLRQSGGKVLLASFAGMTLDGCAYAYDDPYYHDRHRYRERVVQQQPYAQPSRYDDDYDGDHPRYRKSCGSDRCRDGYDRGGYDGSRTFRVCDSDGDRCYGSTSPYWNYREYYRRHGYRWLGD